MKQFAHNPSRRTYDTIIKTLARKNSLPEQYKKQIHRSLISKWKKEYTKKYFGYELNTLTEKNWETINHFLEDKQSQKIFFAYVRLFITLSKILSTVKDFQDIKSYLSDLAD